jgi:glycosyltransferase involved in cell wall biosynthesis
MRAALHSNQLRVAGGGEKYLLSLYEVLSRSTPYRPELWSTTRPERESVARLGVSLPYDELQWHPVPEGTIVRGTSHLDLFVSMHSIPPWSRATHSIAIVQFPFRDYRVRLPLRPETRRAVLGPWYRRCLRQYDQIWCYSDYVRGFIRDYYDREAAVVYPFAERIDEHPAVARTRSIVAVGRFIPMKRHHILIDAFRRLLDATPEARSWHLHLVGGAPVSGIADGYLESLRLLAADLPVTLHVDLPRTDLERIYAAGSIFWQAAGYGADATHPEMFEHFGITTVEAMNFGLAPLVLDAGAQPEVIGNGKFGCTWQSPEELVALTADLIRDPQALAALQARASDGGRRYSKQAFESRVLSLLPQPPL